METLKQYPSIYLGRRINVISDNPEDDFVTAEMTFNSPRQSILKYVKGEVTPNKPVLIEMQISRSELRAFGVDENSTLTHNSVIEELVFLGAVIYSWGDIVQTDQHDGISTYEQTCVLLYNSIKLEFHSEFSQFEYQDVSEDEMIQNFQLERLHVDKEVIWDNAVEDINPPKGEIKVSNRDILVLADGIYVNAGVINDSGLATTLPDPDLYEDALRPVLESSKRPKYNTASRGLSNWTRVISYVYEPLKFDA